MAARDTNGHSMTMENGSFEEIIEDPPEVEITKFHDQFQLLKSKALFLSSISNDSNDIPEDSELEENSRKGHPKPSTYLTSCCLRVLRERMLSRSVMCHQLLRLLVNPPTASTASPLRCSTFNRLKERLEVMARQSSELQKLEVQLADAKAKLAEAQEASVRASEKLSQQLEHQGVLLEQLKADTSHQGNTKLQGVKRKLFRINFMRSLMVMLISHSGVDLRKNRDFANILINYGSPVTMQELRDPAATT